MSDTLPKSAQLLVFGAGAIGQYLGGRLAACGVRTHFIARRRFVDQLDAGGLELVGLDGDRVRPDAALISASETLDAAPTPDLVLLTVKGRDTVGAASALAAACPPSTPVISFQNGVDNIERLRDAAPDLQSIAGMVPFNVVQPAPGRCEQATDGQLAATRCEVTQRWQPMFASAGLPLQLYEDMRPVQWGKLLLNLNNPINALAGVPLRAQLLDRRYRQLLAVLQRETLEVLKAAGIQPAKATPLPPTWLPAMLGLPTPIFRRLAQRMLRISPQARSSMYEDRVAGRPTEIDDLCGAVVRLGEQVGRAAPINRAMVELVRDTSQGTYLSSQELQRQLFAKAVSYE